MPNIDSLISNANRLEQSYNSWNHAYLVFVVITAIVAGLLVLVTGLLQWTANRKHDEFDVAQKSVIAAKDEQLKEDFAHRDERIAKVKADADVSIARVKAESDQKIAAANRRSDEISAHATLDAEKLREQNLATEAKLEQEKSNRLELEEFLQPRQLTNWVNGDKSSIDELKKFAGTPVVIECLADAEPSKAGGQLASLLQSAGWKVLDFRRMLDANMEEGVVVSVKWVFRSRVSNAEADKARRMVHIASAVTDFLEENKWDAKYLELPDVPPDTIKITIGMKPNTYFMPQWFKDMRKRNKEVDEEFRRRFKDRDKPPQ